MTAQDVARIVPNCVAKDVGKSRVWNVPRGRLGGHTGDNPYMAPRVTSFERKFTRFMELPVNGAFQ